MLLGTLSIDPRPTTHLTSSLQNNLLTEKRPRLRISGTVEGIPTLQVADVLDVTPWGALVEHEDTFPPQSLCLLQLGTNGEDRKSTRLNSSHRL